MKNILLAFVLCFGVIGKVVCQEVDFSKDPKIVRGSGAAVPFTLLWQIGYTQIRNARVSYEITDSEGGATSVLSKQDAFAGTAFEPTESIYQAFPDARVLPVLGVGLNIAYRLPGIDKQAIFSREAIWKIYDGQIIYWDDPLLQATNPDIILPHVLIKVFAFESGHNLIWTAALFIFSSFQTPPPSQTPTWNSNFTIITSEDTAQMSVMVASTDYSIGYINLDETVLTTCTRSLQIGALINRAGTPVWGNTTTIQSAMNTSLSLGFFQNISRMHASIMDMPGELDYPIAFAGYIFIDSVWNSNEGDDCEEALELVYFIDWFIHRDTARQLSQAFQMVPIPESFLPYWELAWEQFTCDGKSLYSPILEARRALLLKQELVVDPTVKLIFSSLAGVLTAMCFLLMLFVVVYRKRKVVRASSPVFLQITLLGAILSFSCIFALYPAPSAVVCSLSKALRHVGFAICFSAIFLKTWRVYRVFDVIWTHNHKPITDIRLFIYLAGFVFLMCLYLAIWFAVELPETEVVQENILTTFVQCKDSYWELALFLIEIGCLLFGAVVSHKVRHAPQAFNEAKWMGFSIYNWILLGVMLETLNLTIIDTPDASYALSCILIFMTVGIAMGLLFAPKMYVVFANVQLESATSNVSKRKGSQMLKDEDCDGDCDDNCKYKSENIRVRRELARIQTAISKLDNPHRCEEEANLLHSTDRAVHEALNPDSADALAQAQAAGGALQPDHASTILKRRSLTASISSFFRGSIYSNNSSTSNVFTMYAQPAGSQQHLNPTNVNDDQSEKV